MGILNRFSDVVKSNINALIDRAEDPEKMANQIILDLEKIQQEVTAGVASSIAEEKRLKNLVEQNSAEVKRWENRAIESLKRGEDDMAREALQQKNRFQQDYETYRQQHEQQVAAVNQLKENLRQMNQKLDEARRRRDNLIARQTTARTQKTMAKATSTASSLDVMGKLDRMERKVDETAAMAQAYQELNQEGDLEARFKKMENEQSIESELEALRAKIKGEVDS